MGGSGSTLGGIVVWQLAASTSGLRTNFRDVFPKFHLLYARHGGNRRRGLTKASAVEVRSQWALCFFVDRFRAAGEALRAMLGALVPGNVAGAQPLSSGRGTLAM